MAQTSIDDLLALYDRPFLSAAYIALVGREVDSDGERYYLARLRSGVSRQQVLWELMQSPEAKNLAAEVPGLEALLRDIDSTQSPSLFKRLLPDRDRSRQLIRTENMVGTMSHQIDRLMLMVNHCVFRADEVRRDFDDLRNGRIALHASNAAGEGASRLQQASSVPSASLAGNGSGLFRRMRQGAQGQRKAGR